MKCVAYIRASQSDTQTKRIPLSKDERQLYADARKKKTQLTPRYARTWTLEPVTDPTTDHSGNADEDDPAERGCSRLKWA